MFDITAANLRTLAQHSVQTHLQNTLTICLPLVLYTLWRQRASLLGYVAITSVTVTVGFGALAPDWRTSLLAAMAMHAYHATVTVAVFVASSRLDLRNQGKDTVFTALFVVAIALPALVRTRLGQAVPLVGGWFLCLSLFSYCQDTLRSRSHPSLSDALFFAHVDPSLVFAERASVARHVRRTWPDLARSAGGLGLASIGQTIVFEFPTIASLVRRHAGPDNAYASHLVLGTLCFLAVYWIRAGFVGFQIGLLGLAGHHIHESYDRPYLATSPRDFWKRWNLYVGRWARRYLFGPLALALRRRLRRPASPARSQLSRGVAALATFAAIGLLHDALNFAGEATTRFVFLKTFAFAAAGLLLWEAASVQLPIQRWRGFTVKNSTALTLASVSIRRAVMLHYVAAFPFLLGAL